MKNAIRMMAAAALALACIPLAGCATLGGGPVASAAESEIHTLAAEATESGVRLRCPKNMVELAVVVGGRQTFDAIVAPALSPGQRDRVAAARDLTNRSCGIVVAGPSPAPASAPVDTAPDPVPI
jgi:hypothetical protein